MTIETGERNRRIREEIGESFESVENEKVGVKQRNESGVYTHIYIHTQTMQVGALWRRCLATTQLLGLKDLTMQTESQLANRGNQVVLGPLELDGPHFWWA